MQPNGMIFWDWNGTLMDDVDFTHGCQKQRLEAVSTCSGPDLIGRTPLLRGVALGVHQANSFPASSLAGMRAAITSRISPCS